MAEANNKTIQVQEQEIVPADRTERLREQVTLVPRTDIYETDEDILLTVDIPGVREDNIDITLEKNILSIEGTTVRDEPEGYSLALAEYKVGDYERSFRLTDAIDRDGIEARYENGVLQLRLPKAEALKARKISVKTG